MTDHKQAMSVAGPGLTREPDRAELQIYRDALVRLFERNLQLATPTADCRALTSEISTSALRHTRITPLLSWLAFEGFLRPGDQTGNVESALTLCSAAGMSVARAPRITFSEFPEWALYGVAQIQRDLEAGDLAPQLTEQASNGVFVPRIRRAENLLADVWPEGHQEYLDLIDQIILVGGEGLQSASCPMTFGALYLSPKKHRSLLNLAELLVHETAHHRLEIKTSITKLLTNPDLLARSPLRNDRRPLEYVFHATFVLMRVIDFLRRICNGSDPALTDVAIDLKRRYAVLTEAGLCELRECGEWSAEGSEFFEQVQNLWLELQR